MLYDVQIQVAQEESSLWLTDLTTGSWRRAQDRLKWLIPRTRNARMVDSRGNVVRPEGM